VLAVDSRAAQQERYDAERTPLLRQFGERVRELRGPGRTQVALAHQANLHPTYIGSLERGEQEPGMFVLLILAEVFGVSLDHLTHGLPVPRERRPPPYTHETLTGS
jgi:transcriptional regulator with XRE-family HTH domain